MVIVIAFVVVVLVLFGASVWTLFRRSHRGSGAISGDNSLNTQLWADEATAKALGRTFLQGPGNSGGFVP